MYRLIYVWQLLIIRLRGERVESSVTLALVK